MIEIPQRDLSIQDTKPGWDRDWKGVTIRGPCGHICELSEEHEVTPEGVVYPSIICGHRGCTFHDNVKLIGWEP